MASPSYLPKRGGKDEQLERGEGEEEARKEGQSHPGSTFYRDGRQTCNLTLCFERGFLLENSGAFLRMSLHKATGQQSTHHILTTFGGRKT
jgi:hypothetical protein